MDRGKPGKRLYVIFASSLLLLIFFLILSNYEARQTQDECQNLSKAVERIELEGFQSTGLRIFTDPPENISQISYRSWREQGKIEVGGRTYHTVGPEIRLTIYEFFNEVSPNIEYVANLQKNSPEIRDIYYLGDIEIMSLLDKRAPQPAVNIDIFINERDVYALRYFSESQHIASHILESIIEGL
jgi:hypothetical protein